METTVESAEMAAGVMAMAEKAAADSISEGTLMCK
jgi:hypothetical protein